MDPDKQKLDEIYRLERENNRMLHTMRRNAFWGSIIRWVVYIVIFVLAPLYVYNTYVAPVMQSFQHAVDRVNGTSTKVEAQFSGIQDMWREFESKFTGATTTTK